MKLTIDQRFGPVTVERFIEVYLSEAFNEAVAPVSGLRSRRLVEETVGPDGARHRRVRMQPAITLPAPLAKLARSFAGDDRGDPAERIAYDEVSTVDPASRSMRFRIESAAGDRVRFEGTIRFIADGDHVRRVIDGIIEVKAPLGLGAVVERFIEAETQKGYVRIGAFLQRWLSEHP